MLARVCYGAVASPARDARGTRFAGSSGDVGSVRAPSLAKCRRRATIKIAALASNAGPNSKSVKTGPTEGSDRSNLHNYPVSFSIYHNVQEGDTLTSIAKQYNTSLRSIALLNKIEDIDQLQTGQVLLVPVHPRVFQKVTALVMSFNEDGSQNMAHKESTSAPKTVETVVQSENSASEVPRMASLFMNFIKFTAPLLLLAPIVAICLRYLGEAAHNRIKLEVSRTQAEKDAWDAQHRPKVKRWQGILDGDRDTDAVLPVDGEWMESAEPETEEERKKREEDELRKSYAELEVTYMRFLADSGLSKSGYWRGGIPSAQHDGDFGCRDDSSIANLQCMGFSTNSNNCTVQVAKSKVLKQRES